jgi:hypothetical protein
MALAAAYILGIAFVLFAGIAFFHGLRELDRERD